MKNEQLTRFLLLTAAAAAACALFYVCFRYLLWWLLPFLLALGIALLCNPIVEYLRIHLGFRRGFSSLLLTLTLLFLLGGITSLAGTTLLGEAQALLEKAPKLLAAAPQLLEGLLARLERMGTLCPPWLSEMLRSRLLQTVSDAGTLFSSLAGKLLTALTGLAASLPHFILFFATTILAIYFTLAAYPLLCSFLRTRLSKKNQRQLKLVRSGVTQSAVQWLRSQLVLLCVTFSELLVGFFLMRQSYALLLALLTALLDALPIFGTGTVLLPWAVILLLLGNVPRALALLALYLTTLLIRSILEPKLIASRAGLPPIASLLAMYLGFCTFGAAGMILFPFLLLLAAQVLQQGKKEGRSKT